MTFIKLDFPITTSLCAVLISSQSLTGLPILCQQERGLLRPFSSDKEKLYVNTIAKTNIYEVWSKFDKNQIVPEIELVRSEVNTNIIEKELSNLGVRLGEEDLVF